MITANVAGSAGSHIRPSDRHRDLDRYNSCHDLQNDLDKLEAGLHSKYTANGVEDPRTEKEILAQIEAETRRIRQLISEHRRKKFFQDYKTWAYLVCIAAVVIGAIVLFILLAMGVIATRS
jgi:hypothetical protein